MEKSIASTDLIFVPARSAIQGKYGHHNLVLDVFTRSEQVQSGGRDVSVQRTYTRLVVRVNYDLAVATQLSDIAPPLENTQDMFSLLTSDQSAFLEGELTISGDGQYLRFIRKNIELDVILLLETATKLADDFVLIWYLGGKIVPLLQAVVRKADPDLHQMGLQLLRMIVKDTKARWGEPPENYICSICLTQGKKYLITDVSIIPMTYYGCRTCGQSREFLQQMVVVELDDRMSYLKEGREGIIHVNWFEHQKLFDFEGVLILHATDEAVERFLVQVGNDTDPVRGPRYQQLRCIVLKQCGLSENTLRILRRTFGEVILR